MKKLILVAMFLLGSVSISNAVVLNFETGYDGALGSYGGFTWNNMYTYTYANYNSTFYNSLPAVSGERFIYNGYGTSASLATGSDFDFNGAYLTGWAQSNRESGFNAHTVTINGYNNGHLVGSYTANLTIGTMNYYDVNLRGIDQLVFLPDSNSHWFLMDNFTFSEVAPVPEPSTLLLLGAGLVGLGFARKRFAKK